MVLTSFPFLCCFRLFEIPCDSRYLCLCSFKLLFFNSCSSPFPFTWCAASSWNIYFQGLFQFCLFLLLLPKITYILSSVPFCTCYCPFWALLFVFPCTLWDDGLSPSCCSFTGSVPPEAERQMNKWSEILPLLIPFCFLAPVVHPPPAAQRWSSLITLLWGCSVFEQQEGKKEKSEMGQVKEGRTMGSLLMVFLFSETRFGKNKA